MTGEEWESETSDVAPLLKDKEREPTALPAPFKMKRRMGGPMPNLPTSLGDTPPLFIERNLLARIAKGRERIDATVDLHGMTGEEAQRRLERFIRSAYASAARTLLVITGKGRGGEGVLRRALPQMLEAAAIRPYISAYHTAHAKHGGSGAYYVRIRKQEHE